jgi:hypothetical protein
MNGARIRVEPGVIRRRFRWCCRRFEGSGDCATVRPQGTGGRAGRLPQIGTSAVGAMSEALRANPYCGDVFVFCSKRKDLAADPRRCSASERDAAYDAARRARVDACVAQACEAADVVG